MDPALKQTLTEKFDLAEFSAEQQDRIIDELSDMVMQGVLARTIPVLDDASRAECEQMFDDDIDLIEIFQYLRSHVPTFDAIVDDESRMAQKLFSKNA